MRTLRLGLLLLGSLAVHYSWRGTMPVKPGASWETSSPLCLFMRQGGVADFEGENGGNVKRQVEFILGMKKIETQTKLSATNAPRDDFERQQSLVVAGLKELQDLAQQMGLELQGDPSVMRTSYAGILEDMTRNDDNVLNAQARHYQQEIPEDMDNGDEKLGLNEQDGASSRKDTRRRGNAPSAAAKVISDFESQLVSSINSAAVVGATMANNSQRESPRELFGGDKSFEVDGSNQYLDAGAAARRRLLKALEQGPPVHNGPTCKSCKRPASEQEIADFGKCSFCRRDDLMQLEPMTSRGLRYSKTQLVTETTADPLLAPTETDAMIKRSASKPAAVRKKEPAALREEESSPGDLQLGTKGYLRDLVYVNDEYNGLHDIEDDADDAVVTIKEAVEFLCSEILKLKRSQLQQDDVNEKVADIDRRMDRMLESLENLEAARAKPKAKKH